MSHRSALWEYQHYIDRVLDLMKNREPLSQIQQSVGWFPTVQCTHLEAGSKQILPQAKQLVMLGCEQTHIYISLENDCLQKQCPTMFATEPGLVAL